jgi:hypothetical protein
VATKWKKRKDKKKHENTPENYFTEVCLGKCYDFTLLSAVATTNY